MTQASAAPGPEGSQAGAPGARGSERAGPPKGRLYVGTSGFAYAGWAPRVYDPGSSSREMLAAYARRLPAVELAGTFYRQPSARTVEAWCEATPTTFRFCPRAQRGSAFRALALREAAADALGTREAVSRLAATAGLFGERLGCVFMAVPATLARDDGALERFLEIWPPGLPLALELGHPSWSDDAIHALLRDHGVVLVARDADGGPEPDLRRTGRTLYVRLRRSTYANSDIERWAARLEPFLEAGLDAYAFVRHDEQGTSVDHAAALRAAIGTDIPDPRRRD